MTSSLPAPPTLEPCESSEPPALPAKWRAVALLTPFPKGRLFQLPAVAEVIFDATVDAMLVNYYTLDGGSVNVFFIGDCYYVVWNGTCYGPFQEPNWRVPQQNWLGDKGMSCSGSAPVLGVDCDWWKGTTQCTNSLENQGSTAPCQGETWCAGNWIWTRTDTGVPWRMMFIPQGNPYQLPILGDCAMVHLPTFQELASTKLPDLAERCPCTDDPASAGTSPTRASHSARFAGPWVRRSASADGHATIAEFLDRSKATQEQRTESLDRIGQLIPGFEPLPGDCTPDRLPVWPETLYMTALTTPTFPYQETGSGPWYYDPFPTEVYYDDTVQDAPKQLARFHQPDGTMQDTLLLVPTSYGVSRDADGTVTSCAPLPGNTGPVVRDWPKHDGSRCVARIVNNPELSPDKTTLIIQCPSPPDRVFYIWYTSDGAAVSFMEVPQCCDVSLTLIDYFAFDAAPSLPPGIFDIPTNCVSSRS